MQTGSVLRNGRGWRGYYREDGRGRWTKTYQRKGDARAALQAELERLRLGGDYIPPITLAELADRWLAQYDRAPRTMTSARVRLARVLAAFGDAQAGDVSSEACRDFSPASRSEKPSSMTLSGRCGWFIGSGTRTALFAGTRPNAYRRRSHPGVSGSFRLNRGRRSTRSPASAAGGGHSLCSWPTRVPGQPKSSESSIATSTELPSNSPARSPTPRGEPST